MASWIDWCWPTFAGGGFLDGLLDFAQWKFVLVRGCRSRQIEFEPCGIQTVRFAGFDLLLLPMP